MTYQYIGPVLEDRDAIWATRAAADADVVAELTRVGVRVGSIYDLVNTREPYPAAIPVLIALLPRVREAVIFEGVVRALICREAKGIAAATLLDALDGPPPVFTHPQQAQIWLWTIGHALYTVAKREHRDRIERVVRDPSSGAARDRLVDWLARFKDERAERVLLQVVDDEALALHAMDGLARMASTAARPKIARYLDHQDLTLPRVARRALARIARAERAAE